MERSMCGGCSWSPQESQGLHQGGTWRLQAASSSSASVSLLLTRLAPACVWTPPRQASSPPPSPSPPPPAWACSSPAGKHPASPEHTSTAESASSDTLLVSYSFHPGQWLPFTHKDQKLSESMCPALTPLYPTKAWALYIVGVHSICLSLVGMLSPRTVSELQSAHSPASCPLHIFKGVQLSQRDSM